MEIRQLKNFLAVAEELHFGRAAARLSMTQPPLSSSIMQLEDELGARLFDRDKKRVRMTPAGKALYPEARQILMSLKRASDITSAVAQGLSGEIHIGYSTSMLYRGLPKILKTYQTACPNVSIVLHESQATSLVEALRHKNIDAAFVNMTFVPEGLCGNVFSREEFICCVPVGHRLSTLTIVKISDLRDEDFVMFSREVSPANYDNVIQICRTGGIEPRMRYGASQWMNMVALVAHGFGVTIVPKSLANCGISNAVFVQIEPNLGLCEASFLWNEDHVEPTLPTLLKAAKDFA